jgi:prepilin-type processing-associated H-X9-DG protein
MMKSRCRRPSCRRALTLIELCVVIAVIAILIGMLVPAVQKARESASGLRCKSALQQIGFALHNYHAAHKKFPVGRPLDPVTGENGSYTTYIYLNVLPPTDESCGGWMFRILPYIDQGALYDQAMAIINDRVAVRTVRTIGSRPIPLFQCPSDGRASQTYAGSPPKGGQALTSYLGVTGNDEWREARFYGSNARNGIFAPRSWVSSKAAKGTRIKQISDGTSNTTMVGERPPSDDLYWGWWHGSDFDTMLANPNREASVLTSASGGVCPAPSYFQPDVPSNPCAAMHYWSMHPGGGNWLMADGAVRFFTYNVGITLLPAMASINGGEETAVD